MSSLLVAPFLTTRLLPADGLVTYESTDDVPWTTDGRPSDNEFIDNVVSNTPLGIRLSNGDDNVVTGGKL